MSLLLHRSTSQGVKPLWHQPQRLFHAIPRQYKTWLLDKGSLTKKLRKKSNHQLRVEVLQQRLQRPNFSESKALHIHNRRWAVVREVILHSHQCPWVYARTVIPLSSLKGPLRRLHYLGNKPLGERLFADPSMRREPVAIAKLSGAVLPDKLAVDTTVWGRRSVFRLARKPLLVSEIFLPTLFLSDD